MSVIQNIQDKYAKLMAVIIALALIIFVVMLAFENGGSLFRGGNSTVVGTVDGKNIEYNAIEPRIKQQEEANQQQGYPAEMARQTALEQVWSQEIGKVILENEAGKLGMQIGKRELGDILYGANPPEDLKRMFTDPNTGIYNAQKAKQDIDQMLKAKATTPEQKAQKAQFNTFLNYLELIRINDKYNSLLLNTTNFPKWFIEKQNADNSQIANISLARQAYSSIPDSVVKVTESDIQNYISKHKDQFKQEETRGISYVSFSALPTGKDSSDAYDRLMQLKPGLDTSANTQDFLEAQGVENFYNSYINGNKIQIPVKDSIFRIPVGTTYGPYLDGGGYSMAKLLGVRTQADSVTVRHILIATASPDPQTGAMMQIRDTVSAKNLIDSIQRVIATGSNFDTVCAKLSEDPGSKEKGGVYEKVTSGQMVASFNEFIFGRPVGSKGIVKTEYGYHYIEIQSAKGASTAYKIAYLSTPIEASNETDGSANNAASQFASSSRDRKSFDANAEKLQAKGVNKAYAQDITPTASQVMGLGSSRTFVKAIYEAKLGDVMEPMKVGDNYVVALLTEVSEKGTQSVSKARMMVEPLLRNQKKAEEIIKKIGNITTLEAAATAMGNAPIETADSIRISGMPPSPLVSSEPRVLGAAFNPANKGKVVTQAIPGNNGVYVVRVDNVSATAVADANVAEQRQQRYQQTKMRGAGYYQQALMQAANIKDNRAKFF
jgi:peptidyl-prolyl cis-trans isomerase D